MEINALSLEQRTGRRPKPKWTPIFPAGTRQPKYNKAVAQRFCELLGSTHLSLMDLLAAHPELPPWDQLESWRASKPDFAESWRKAREAQANHLIQLGLTIAAETNPKNAHSQRVKFDIYKWVASKFHPVLYGDKPAQTAVNVAVGFNVSTQRLEEIRGKLDITRNVLKDNHKVTPNGNRDGNGNDSPSHDSVSNTQRDSDGNSVSLPLLKDSQP